MMGSFLGRIARSIQSRRHLRRQLRLAPSRGRAVAQSLESRTLLSVAPVLLSAPREYAPAGPRGAVGDFSNDGRPDIVVVNEIDSDVMVMMNTGNGTFLPPAHHYVLNARDVAVADFNHDGNLDMAVLSPNGEYTTVEIFYGLGNGNFLPPQRIKVGSGAATVAAADLNGNGLPDLVLSSGESAPPLTDQYGAVLPNQPSSSFGGEKVIVLRNLGNGVFSKPVRYRAGPYFSRDLVIGDFNGDGVPDVAVLRAQNDFAVLLGQKDASGHPTGTLGPPTLFAAGSNPRALAAGDFNRDGKLDLAVANSDFHTAALKIYQGNGDGTFAPGQNYFGGNFVDGVAVGDFNGDGIPDLAAVSFTSDLRVYPGNGDGTFAPPQNFPGGRFGNFVLAADFDGDGRTDVAVLSSFGTSILFAGPTAPPVGSAGTLDVPMGAGHRSLRYQDAGGAPAIVTLSGPGSAVLHFSGAGLALNSAGTAVVGGPATLGSIAASGTTAASTLSVSVVGRNGIISVGSISSDGSLRAIVAPAVNARDVNIAGSIGSIQFDNASSGAIHVNGGGARLNLSLASAQDESLFSNEPIGRLSVGQWYSPDGVSEQIIAPSIASLASVGQFSPDLTLGAGGLGSATASMIVGGNWTIAGRVGTVHAVRDAMFSLSAASIGSVSAGSLLNNSTISASGDIGSISAYSLYNSAVFAGVAALPSGQRLPESSGDFANSGATIGSIDLRQRAGYASFLNSVIAAPRIGRANLGSVGFSNSGQPFGIAAHSISLLTGTDVVTRKSFALRDPTSTAALSARGINPADFVLRVI